MSDNNRNGGAGFLEGLFLGVILGGVLGVLYAPQAGDKTRAWIKKIKDENQDIIDNAMVSSENLIKTTKDSIEDGFNKVSKIIDTKLNAKEHKEKVSSKDKD